MTTIGGPAGAAVEYLSFTRTEPRPLRIHVLRVDLLDKSQQLVVAVGADPDGPGPAEAQLVPPQLLAAGHQLFAAVNASAWDNIPAPPEGQSPLYVPGVACDVLGLVVAGGVLRSPAHVAYWSFWLDEKGLGHIGALQNTPETKLAVSGFSGLLQQGKVLPQAAGALHPRTALGLDASGRKLVLLVVDGRQPGYSEGASEYELAGLMAEQGCTDALNLDGGGSTIMLQKGAIMNRPSNPKEPRPVPVMLGVRKAPDAPRAARH